MDVPVCMGLMVGVQCTMRQGGRLCRARASLHRNVSGGWTQFFFSTSHKLAFHPRGGGAEGDKGLSLPRSESRTEQGQLACRSGLCRAVRLFL